MKRGIGLSIAILLAGCYGRSDEETTTQSEPLLAKRLHPMVEAAAAAFPGARVVSTSGGVAGFMSGRFDRKIGAGEVPADLSALFALDPIELEATRTVIDELGRTSLHYRQMRDGLPVANGMVVLHVGADGELIAIQGTARGESGGPREAVLSADEARDRLESEGWSADEVRLTYVITSGERDLHLAYAFEVNRIEDGAPIAGTWFVDAIDGAVVERQPRTQSVLERRVHDANGQQALPGLLGRGEGDPASSDAMVNTAYDHSGNAHACFALLFGRDAIDGGGGAMITTVHFGSAYNNAFWNGEQMVFGDGDGSVFSNLAAAYDITVHEAVHGITQHTAGLVYQNEPGALNEAFSDVIAAACEALRAPDDATAIWSIGEVAYTPSIAGDALRYLADPARDGISRDYYPNRHQDAEDNGGVHLNSGIINLAFALLANGGAHPRGRSNIEVPALGIMTAAQIYYRALTTYLTPISTMQDARAATAQAAVDLFGATAADAVHQSWNAVGVLAGQGPRRHDPLPLIDGVAITDLRGDAGEERIYRLEVPADAVSLSIQMSGGTGDTDLYVRFGEPPTLVAWDHRPYLVGNAESVELTRPITGGSWYAMVQGFGAYTGVSLIARVVRPELEACTGGNDEDYDGTIDCNDADCAQHPACVVESCAPTGVDEDQNGLTDCADPFCNTECEQQVGQHDLVISELMPAPVTSAEWLEIHNTSTRAIDLAGFTLRLHGQEDHRIARSLPIAGRGYAVIALAAFDADYVLPATTSLFDRGDQIALVDRRGIELDRVTYPHAPLVVWSGVSFEASASAWCYSAAAPYDAEGNRGTPGAPSQCAIARARAARLGELVITEVAADWFEVASRAEEPIDLYGVAMELGGVTQAIDRSIVVLPGARSVVEPSHGTIVLRSQNGEIYYDRVETDGAVELDVLALDPVLNDSPSAWCPSAGTPGAAGACGPEVTRRLVGTVPGSSGELAALVRDGDHHISLVEPALQWVDHFHSLDGGAYATIRPHQRSDRPHAGFAIDSIGRHYTVSFLAAFPGFPDRYYYTGPGGPAEFEMIYSGALGQASVAMDSRDRVHFTYGTKYGVVLFWYENGWRQRNVASFTTGNGFLSGLVLDASDRPHVVYHDPVVGQLHYARWNGTSWSRTELGPINQGTTPAAIALGPDGTAHIVYDSAGGLNRVLNYVAVGPSGVVRSIVARRVLSGNGHKSGIVVDDHGRPHVVYQSGPSGALRLVALFDRHWSGLDLPDSISNRTEIVVGLENGVAVITAANKSSSTDVIVWRAAIVPPPLFVMGGRGDDCKETCAREGRACGGSASVALDCGAYPEVDWCDDPTSWIYSPNYGGFCTDSWSNSDACSLNVSVVNQFCCRCE